MKALFVTTQTNDTHNLIDAWDSVSPEPARRFEFDYLRQPVNGFIISAAQVFAPEVIFYIGSCEGVGLPSFETFRTLRQIAPVINLIPDAGDPPWHGPIKSYREEECFDLHVGLDGCPDSPVDHVTITPVNPVPYQIKAEKDIRCGFSGTTGGKRDGPLKALGDRCTIRVRDGLSGAYTEHAHFLKRCRIVFNTAWTGTGEYYHVKGRVLEAGYAEAALLESQYSPADHWFPENAYFRYADNEEAVDIVMAATDEDIDERAARLAQIVREKYHPGMIYKGMLDRIGLDPSFTTDAYAA